MKSCCSYLFADEIHWFLGLTVHVTVQKLDRILKDRTLRCLVHLLHMDIYIYVS